MFDPCAPPPRGRHYYLPHREALLPLRQGKMREPVTVTVFIRFARAVASA